MVKKSKKQIRRRLRCAVSSFILCGQELPAKLLKDLSNTKNGRVSFDLLCVQKVVRYCSESCRSADWAHKLLCYDAAAVKEGIDALDKVPIQAKVLDTRKPDISLDNIYLQIVKWYTAHKNSFYYAFLAALGMVNHSPWGPPDLLVNPRVFYIIADSSPNLTAETKGRFAFRVTHAQVLTMQELQCSSSTAPVRTYDEDHQLIVARFQEYERLQPCSNPKNKKVLIILRFHFQNSTGEMFTFAPVYYEREFLADLESVAWLVPNWRERLIYGVVTGAGFDPTQRSTST